MYKRDKSILTDFKKFLKKDSLPLNQFTTQLVKDFETYLIVDKENQVNTVTGKMKRLRMYAKKLFAEDRLDMRDFPFRNYITKTEPTEREFLTEREFKKLLRYKKKCTPVNPLRDTLDLFLMECYTGLRIYDLLTLKWKHYHDGLIRKKMEKTKLTISLLVAEIDIADAIITVRYNQATKNNKQIDPELYIFKMFQEDLYKATPTIKQNAISSATASINKKLKTLAKINKINKKLSTHIARHLKSD